MNINKFTQNSLQAVQNCEKIAAGTAMNINKFTQNSLQAVQNCEKIAADNGNQELAQEHLLYALLTQDDSLILKLLDR